LRAQQDFFGQLTRDYPQGRLEDGNDKREHDGRVLDLLWPGGKGSADLIVGLRRATGKTMMLQVPRKFT